MTALVATGHPLQRAGAWAVAVLAERDDPSRVSVADLDAVSSALVADLLAAATAPKGSSWYDWWKVLFALTAPRQRVRVMMVSGSSLSRILMAPSVVAET
ncbi:hypothetical protein [Streptomyces sp. FH025]|uniref:hypothetical protein n=1 Tax=Streptomyces sp. FH025 TaxID=2815937 RepID=UPI001FAE7D3C|nr:hypothetical protein [Streptomyces sp. FH025]